MKNTRTSKSSYFIRLALTCVALLALVLLPVVAAIQPHSSQVGNLATVQGLNITSELASTQPFNFCVDRGFGVDCEPIHTNGYIWNG